MPLGSLLEAFMVFPSHFQMRGATKHPELLDLYLPLLEALGRRTASKGLQGAIDPDEAITTCWIQVMGRRLELPCDS